MTKLTITPAQARRLAITRQRLAGPQPAPTPAGIMNIMRDIRCLQLDPIRAVERTQYLVLWSRLGQYNPKHLDTLLFKERQLFEYWAHAASIVLTDDYPIHQAYMLGFANGNSNSSWHQRFRDWVAENEPFRQYILERLSTEGPLSAGQLEDRSIRSWSSDGWNHNRNVGQMLSALWEQGEIMVAQRQGLQKKWGLTRQCLPDWTSREALPEKEVVRQAAQISLRALGVGTAKQITNHFTRNRYPGLDAVLSELTAAGLVVPAQISNGKTTWPGDWYIHSLDLPLLQRLDDGAWQPRTTLLSPFDNLICDRDRTESMWDFYFRIEIYVPRAKRQYGYYVLPILHGDTLVGRVDPRMDRKTGTLYVSNIYAEPDAPQNKATGQAVANTIEDLAGFLGAKQIEFGEIPAGWKKGF